MPTLFDPITLGKLTLPNRIFMAPLTRARTLKGAIPNVELKAEYYGQRASAGLMIAEATAVSADGLGWLNAPGIWNDDQQHAWAKITQAVHKKGGRIFLQIWHMGAVVVPDFIDQQKPLSPSGIKLEGEIRTPLDRKQSLVEPKVMSIEDIQAVQQSFVNGAKRAIDAGFDGVEIHAANGFLIDQFIRDLTNKRTDAYGGSTENRLKFCIEIVNKVCAAIGNDRVGVRISPTNSVWGIADSQYKNTFTALASALNDYELAYLHLLEPRPNTGHPLETIDFISPLIREVYNGTMILNGGYTASLADEDLEAGLGDAVAFGLPFIANPNLVYKFEHKLPLHNPDVDTFYTNDANGYTDYPIIE